MRILIFEPFPDGHRLAFVRRCAEAVTDLAAEIIFATSRSTPARPEFHTHIQPVISRLRVDDSLDEQPLNQPLRAARMRWRSLRRAITRHAPDHAYIPYGDGLVQMAALARAGGPLTRLAPRGVELEAIMLRGRFAYPHDRARDGPFGRAWLTATALAPFEALHHLDPIPYEAIMRRGGRLAQRSRLIPEPVETLTIVDRREARRRLNLPMDGRLICCPGWLDQRKGADRLIRAFAAAAERASLRADDRLLLAGRVDAPVRRALDEHDDLVKRGRIIANDGCVSDEDLHLSMSAADVVCAPYPRHIGSSGVIVRAAGLQRMIVTSDFGWLGMVTQRFGLGMACECGDDAVLARVLPEALDRSPSFRPSEAAARFSQYHTQANFAGHISARLRERLGKPAATGLRTWAWVNEGADGR